MSVIRQGDVCLVRVRAIPKDAVEQPSAKRVVLAFGEVTGHAHAFYDDSHNVKLYVAHGGARYLDVSGLFSGLEINGRAQPFAPGYKLAAAAEYHDPSGWFARLDASALDSFYYYTSDAQTSRAYNLENLRVGYQRGGWTMSLWVRNLFEARYAQQGFYFGLIPPNFPNQSFLQLGDPRQIGITLNYHRRAAKH